MPVLGFPLRDVSYCIIMTDSEMVPITDKTIFGPVDGVLVLSAAILSPRCSQSPGGFGNSPEAAEPEDLFFFKAPSVIRLHSAF